MGLAPVSEILQVTGGRRLQQVNGVGRGMGQRGC